MEDNNNFMRLRLFVTSRGKLIREWLSKRENILWVVLLTAHLIPIWIFDYFPSQDGPSHLNNAAVIREFFQTNTTVYREYYSLNLSLFPNWSGYVALIGLMFVFTAGVAEKIFLSGYILLLPISARYALKAVSPDKSFLAFLIVPFVFNYSFHMGFYNFCYSLPVFFFLIGYWLKNQKRFTFKTVLGLMGLSFLLYFCHIVSLVMAYSLIAVLIVWPVLMLVSQQLINREFVVGLSWQKLSSRLYLPLAAFFPSVILAIWFFKKQQGKVSLGMSVPDLIQALLGDFSYQVAELPLTYFFAGMIFLILFYHLLKKVIHRSLDDNDGFFLVILVFVAIFFIAPEVTSGGSFVHTRLRLFVFFALILWFAAQPYKKIFRELIIGISTGVAFLQLGLHIAKYAELDDYLREYMSGIQLIAPNSTLLPLCFEPGGLTVDRRNLSLGVQPFSHAAGYIAAERRVVDLTNYEGNIDYFPVQFRPERNPYMHIGDVETLPSSLDFLTYPSRTGGRVDYVLIWEVSMEQVSNDENTREIFEQLEVGYDLVYTSPQHGLMHLYKRKNYTDYR